MEFKRSTDEEFNRKILAMETVVIEGEQSFQTIEVWSNSQRDHESYIYRFTLAKLKEHRDKKLPLESLFVRNYLYDSAFLCIAAVSDDMIIFVTAASFYAIRERDWEVWVACLQAKEDFEIDIREKDWSFEIKLWESEFDSSPEYVTALEIRGTQSFDGIVVEMGILVDGTPDGEFLVMTTETFEELKHTTNAEAIGMSDWTSWTDLEYWYLIEKVCLLSVDGDEIRLSIGEENYMLSCCEKLDIISKCKETATSKVLTRIYATKDGLPLYLSPEDAEIWKQRAEEKITADNVLGVRTFEVQGTPSFRTVFIRFALMDIQSSVLLGGEIGNPAKSYPLDKLKGKIPMLYCAGSFPAFRVLAVVDDVLFVAEHDFDRKGRLTTNVIQIRPGECYYCYDDPLNNFSRYGLEIFTKRGE